VTDFAPGDRVATFGPTRGAYTTARNLPARDLFRLPDTIDDRTAAALMLKGATTEFLVERCAKVRAGQTVLVHAGAGGVGQLLCGWLKALGATVIATVGAQEKVATAKAAGAEHVILYRDVDTAEAVRAIVPNGVAVTFDGVGKATWAASLAATARRGLVVSYGNASGAVDGVNLGLLARSGSLFVTRPTLFDYYVTPEERGAGIARVFEMLSQGAIAANIGQTFALEDVADAHRALEAGKTQGSTVLLP
jgi:NADPH2:quinone reductase